MKTFLCALLFFFCQAPPPARGVVNVMTYGDSLSTATSYPTALQALRPDLTVYPRGLNGDVSWNIARFDAVLAERTWDHVVIMLGVNDPFGSPGYDPHDTFKNIWTMATHAKNAGAEVYLLTPLPASSAGSGPVAQPYTLAVANELAHRDLDNAHAHVTILYLRDQFTTRNWLAHTTDGIHLNDPGKAVVAGFVAAALP